ncbi:MAG: 30S ribosomal protein S9 [Nitrospiraceae bacterium]|jgi:small subunit ribosomal protein S9|uniref:30S ribosomal protein S9 n=1 Tax=Nitrospira cf. moscoviensis SBR1015 TaxID=96242 RepID=UPI000A0B0B78|nr:30S ribosomal protein S9 [Nitrospira cf. moscoviensis SBR1015]MBY0249079.1 30S ribosomal protein S9 [Nitrospiraceae bacterium]OQW36581.1 MAG: 30S ribosomal protein S9 [Nitrospira sp. SG-bin2]
MAVVTQYATGRRKCAIARAWVTGTAGEITVNEKPLEKAFPRLTLRQIIQLPLEMAGVMGKYSISATVYGGGPAGQAGALRHAIARALVAMTPTTRPPLKKEGLLTRDSRVKERKKYGQKGARKRFQYSKR